MTTIKDQAKWHEDQAKECDDHADHYIYTVDTEDQDDVLIEAWRADAARHRASAAMCRELISFRNGGAIHHTVGCPRSVPESDLTDRLLSEIPHA